MKKPTEADTVEQPERGSRSLSGFNPNQGQRRLPPVVTPSARSGRSCKGGA